jgi:hypothetical protein
VDGGSFVAAARGAETDNLSLVTTHKHTGTAGVVLKKDVDRAWPRRRSWTACLPIQPTGRDVGWRARQTSVRRLILDLSRSDRGGRVLDPLRRRSSVRLGSGGRARSRWLIVALTARRAYLSLRLGRRTDKDGVLYGRRDIYVLSRRVNALFTLVRTGRARTEFGFEFRTLHISRAPVVPFRKQVLM